MNTHLVSISCLNSTIPRWNSTIPCWNSTIPRWNSTIPRWNSTIPNSTIPRSNSTIPRWNSAISQLTKLRRPNLRSNRWTWNSTPHLLPQLLRFHNFSNLLPSPSSYLTGGPLFIQYAKVCLIFCSCEWLKPRK